jgi:hypothetical protein
MAPDSCPNCGADVPLNSTACPECGSDEKTGWSDTAYAGRLGLPDDEFDHYEFVKREFPSHAAKPRGVRWIWWVTALLLVLLFVFLFFR